MRNQLFAFNYLGGKCNLVPVLLKLLPPHLCYVEVFGGAANLLLNKPPSKVEIFNDIDSGITTFFRVLRDHPKELIQKLELTPFSREEFYFYRDNWNKTEDEIEKARRWYFVARASFAGRWGSSWEFSIQQNQAATSQKAYKELKRVSERLQIVQIENNSWHKILELYSLPSCLLYLDPPYIQSTRRCKNGYQHEMSIKNHIALVHALKSHPSMIILSCYYHEVYKKLIDTGWQKIQIKTTASSIGRTKVTNYAADCDKTRIETILLNPKCVEALQKHKPLILNKLNGNQPTLDAKLLLS